MPDWNWQLAGQWLLALAMIGVMPLAMNRSINNMGGTDFPEYYAAGRYVLKHGTIKPNAMTAYYLPSIDVLFAGLALLPKPAAAALWYVAGCIAWLGLLSALGRYFLDDIDPTIRRKTQIAVGLLVLPLVLDQLCLGAFHVIMLWWMVAGLGRIQRNKPWTGAALLGLAIWLKLLPGLGVVYLLIKRRWKEAVVALLVALCVNVGLTLIAFSPRVAWEAHVAWLHNDAAGTANLLLSDTTKINEQRVTNQSLPAVLRRVLTRMGYPSRDARDLAAWGKLNSAQLKAVYFTIVAILAGGVFLFCRRDYRLTSSADRATEAALIVLSTLWFSPIAPSYHPLVVAPALALILGRRWQQRLAWSAVGLWAIAMALHAAPLARAFGHVLWMTFVLAWLLWKSSPVQAAVASTRVNEAASHMQPAKAA